MRLKLFCLILFAATGSIVLRRLAWGQVPTQVPSLVVWATVAINLAVIGYLLWRGTRFRS